MTVDPVPIQNFRDILYGEGLYLKNKLNNADCSAIDTDGVYRNVLGTFPNGQQAYYAGHGVLFENTVEDPIADGGNLMINVNVTGYGEDFEPDCPVAPKNFLNGKNQSKEIKNNDLCFTKI